jgi:sialidase-1
MITELSDGRVMLVARSVRRKPIERLSPPVLTAQRNWTKPAFHDQLWEPVCMASIVAHPSKPGTLIFSNPHTLKLGKDGKEVTCRQRQARESQHQIEPRRRSRLGR